MEKTCVRCGCTIAMGNSFCSECGSEQDVIVCPSCNGKMPAQGKFCPICGVSCGKKEQSQRIGYRIINWLCSFLLLLFLLNLVTPQLSPKLTLVFNAIGIQKLSLLFTTVFLYALCQFFSVDWLISRAYSEDIVAYIFWGLYLSALLLCAFSMAIDIVLALEPLTILGHVQFFPRYRINWWEQYAYVLQLPVYLAAAIYFLRIKRLFRNEK